MLDQKADKDATNIDEAAKAKWAEKLGTGKVAANDTNLVTGKTVKTELDKKVDTTTYTAGMATKADANGSNVTNPETWAEKLGTGVIADKDTNLVTGGKVYAAIKDKADKSELTNKADTNLDNLTEQGKTEVKNLAGEKITETLTNTFVTDKVTKGSIKSDTLDVTGEGKAIGSDLTINIKDGSITKAKLNNELKTEIEGKATKDDLAKKAETTYVDNQLKTKVNTSDFNTYKGEVTTALGKKADAETVTQQLATKVNTSDFNTYKGKVTTDLAGKADVNGGNITAPGKWAEKLGTGEVAANNANLVTGGKVFAAIKDKADKSDLTSKANTNLDNLTEQGKTEVKNLAGEKITETLTNTFVTDKVTKGSIKSDTLDVTGEGKAIGSDLTINIKDGSITKAKLNNELKTEIEGKATKDDLAKKAETTYVDNQLKTKVNTSDFNTYKGEVTTALGKKADAETVTQQLATKVNTSDFNTYKGKVTTDLAGKADVNGGNITAPGKWAEKLGTGTVAANDTNLVTGKTVYDFVNPVKTQAETNATNITTLQKGFTIKDAGTGTSNVTLGGDTATAITFKAATENTENATSSFVASVDKNKNVTYTLNTKKLKEELGITENGVGTMSSWKIQATGGTATNVADGEIVEFGTEADKGLTVTQTGKTIKYGINTDTVIDNINNSTTKKITNVDGDCNVIRHMLQK